MDATVYPLHLNLIVFSRKVKQTHNDLICHPLSQPHNFESLIKQHIEITNGGRIAIKAPPVFKTGWSVERQKSRVEYRL